MLEEWNDLILSVEGCGSQTGSSNSVHSDSKKSQIRQLRYLEFILNPTEDYTINLTRTYHINREFSV